MVKGKKWVLKQHFEGMPKRSDLEVVEFDLPPVGDGCKLASGFFFPVPWTMEAWLAFDLDVNYSTNRRGFWNYGGRKTCWICLNSSLHLF